MKNKQTIKIGLMLIGAVFMSNQVLAQNSVLRGVGAALSYAESDASYLVEAKNGIDKAYKNSKTANSPRMWLYRSMVYSRLSFKKGNARFEGADLSNAGLESGISMKKFLEHTGEKKDDDIEEAEMEAGSAFAATFNEHYAIQNRDSAIMYLEVANYLFDRIDTGSLRKFANSGITKSSVSDRLMYFVATSDNDETKKRIFSESINSGNVNAVAFEGMAGLLLKEGDTAKAEVMLMDAYQKNAGDKDMFNVLKNFYISSGQTNKLLAVVEEMIKKDESNSSYYYLRGKLRDDVQKEHELARKDYLKAIELDAFNYDAFFDLGANLVSHETMKWRNMKINARTDADIKIANEGLIKVYKQAEEYLLTAAENTKYGIIDKINLYKALNVVYLELDDNGKAQYYKTLAKGLETELKK